MKSVKFTNIYIVLYSFTYFCPIKAIILSSGPVGAPIVLLHVENTHGIDRSSRIAVQNNASVSSPPHSLTWVRTTEIEV